MSDGAIDQGNVTLSRFTVTADNRTTMDMEIYFTDAEDAFAAKNLLTTPQIGLQFQELGLGWFPASWLMNGAVTSNALYEFIMGWESIWGAMSRWGGMRVAS